MSISDGCSTSSVQLVNARRSSLRAARRDHAVEARVGDPERLGGRVVALGLGDRREQLGRRRVGRVLRGEARRAAPRARCAPRPARSSETSSVSSITAIDSLTLRRMPSLCVLSTKMPPPGPCVGADQVRAREQPQPLAQRRAADAELGRELLLGAEALARPQVALGEVAPDLERDLLAGVPARRAEARAGTRHGANVASGATATSSSSGSSRSARPGSTSSSTREQLGVLAHGARRAAERAREARDVDVEARPRAPCRRPARRAGP